jgi:hypothetical protein
MSKEEIRKRGIFTPADRDYLRDEYDGVDGQDKRNARYRHRQRLTEALQDLPLVMDMQTDDRRTVFESLNNEELTDICDAMRALQREVEAARSNSGTSEHLTLEERVSRLEAELLDDN